jgi:hypothetical protein
MDFCLPFFAPPTDVASPGMVLGMLALTIGALFILFLLIVVIESTALQLLAWDTFRKCLRASFWMNLASTAVGFFFLTLIPKYGLPGLILALALSIVIEGLVLSRRKPGETRRNWLAAVVANLASYLLLIFPTYYFSGR